MLVNVTVGTTVLRQMENASFIKCLSKAREYVLEQGSGHTLKEVRAESDSSTGLGDAPEPN